MIEKGKETKINLPSWTTWILARDWAVFLDNHNKLYWFNLLTGCQMFIINLKILWICLCLLCCTSSLLTSKLTQSNRVNFCTGLKSYSNSIWWSSFSILRQYSTYYNTKLQKKLFKSRSCLFWIITNCLRNCFINIA